MMRRSVVVLPFLLTQLAAQAGPIDWHTDLAAARQLAAERHAPLFVVFRCER